MNIHELIRYKILDKVVKSTNLSLPELFLPNRPLQTRFAESYRTLRTNISFASVDKELQSVTLTSSIEKEGKTTTAANLAYTIAQTGKSVLIIDADLRKPSLSNLVHDKNTTGLSGLLSTDFSVEIRNGSLQDFGISDLIRLLAFQKKTGVLHLNDSTERVNLYFKDGEIYDVNWLTRPDEKKIANLLIKSQLLTREQAELAMARKQSTNQKLGFILLSMNFVKEDDLTGFISLHMIEGLKAALQFKYGIFAFENLAEEYFQRPSFDPVNLAQTYRQAVIGEEDLPYLQKTINSAIIKMDTNNLNILPSGPRPIEPVELLGSNRMSFLLSFLKKRFDFIVIDTPPVLPATDALLLAPQTDGVILMVKGGYTDRKMVKKVVEQIKNSKANLLGVVLSQVDIKREGYYKYYSKYYTKYYEGDKLRLD